MLGSFACLFDLLDGSVVLDLEQTDSVAELYYIFLDPTDLKHKKTYKTLCLWACSSMYPV